MLILNLVPKNISTFSTNKYLKIGETTLGDRNEKQNSII